MRPRSYADLPRPENIVVVVGYPRSGNTYISRLIGDVLDSPVGGYKSANPICTEGQDRPGAFYVMQLHASPIESPVGDHAIESAIRFNVSAWKGEKVVHVLRDPRDVAVSAMYYWDLPNVRSAIEAMKKGTHPFGGVGCWDRYIELWLDCWKPLCTSVFYEEVLSAPILSMEAILESFDISVPPGRIAAAAQRQSFDVKRAQIGIDGDGRPYGRSVQLKHMRKGVPGDWRTHFKHADGEVFEDYFGDKLIELGYENGNDWYDSLDE